MTTTAVVTSGMVQPILDQVSATIPVLLPVGLGIMALVIGVSLVPRIIHKFF